MSDVLNGEQFYHGTAHDFEPGDEIIPPSRSGADPVWPKSRSSLHMAYATTSMGEAIVYAQAAAKGELGRQRVYEVEPLGHHRANRASSPHARMSSQGWRVVRRV